MPGLGVNGRDDTVRRHPPGDPEAAVRANPSLITSPPPVPFADAEPGPIQIVNSSAITSPNILRTISPVLSEMRLSSRRHCRRTTRWGAARPPSG